MDIIIFQNINRLKLRFSWGSGIFICYIWKPRVEQRLLFAMTTEVVLWFVTWNHDSVCQIRSLSYKIRDKGTRNQMLGTDSLKTKDTAQKFFICMSVVLIIISVPRPLCIRNFLHARHYASRSVYVHSLFAGIISIYQ